LTQFFNVKTPLILRSTASKFLAYNNKSTTSDEYFSLQLRRFEKNRSAKKQDSNGYFSQQSAFPDVSEMGF